MARKTEVLLRENLKDLGKCGDVVRVAPGYARNFLIPKGKAKRATEANLAEFEKRRAELEKVHADALASAQERAAKLDGLMIQIKQKAGVDGRLFGSVTNHDIADALEAQGFAVEKGAVRLPDGPLKLVGDHAVSVALHTDVVVGITVSVLGE